jgi:hypothetical protein
MLLAFFIPFFYFILLFWLNDFSFWLLISITFLLRTIFFFFFWLWDSYRRSFNRYFFFLCPLLNKINLFKLANIVNIVAHSHCKRIFVDYFIFIKLSFLNFILSNIFWKSFKKLCIFIIMNHQI